MYSIFALLVSLFLHGSAHAAVDLTGDWKGTYRYITKNLKPVNFEIHLVETGEKLTGKTVEPNTFSESPVKHLHADIRGSVNPDLTISFLKTYDGTGGATHSVEYAGKISADGAHVKGTWKRLQSVGTFTLERKK